MAQEEPLYDFPEPAQHSEQKLLALQRGRASLKSISVLDRLLLTVPVWFQLSINPATALHILQREPPGTFLVRKSRTSQRNVLCVRLTDDSVPSFVQQFGIRQQDSSNTLSLETSGISFPDLPRLVSFYCVSRDVLRFPLELPEAIAKASSHKELESISHMGIEFWNSHLNVRGPREAPKPQKKVKEDPGTPVPPAAAPQTASAAQPDAALQPDSDKTSTKPDSASKQSISNPTLFHEFCPITTRSPVELDYGSGQGALCFVNPLFLQSQNALCRRRMFKRSLNIRISTESSTLLSPPLARPPPPPLMPKTKQKCKAQKHTQGMADPNGSLLQEKPSQDAPQQGQTQVEPDQSEDGVTAQLPSVIENLPEDSDYMQPSPMINFSHAPSLLPYLSPSNPMVPPLPLKASSSFSLHEYPGASPSLSPYQSPSLSPKAPFSISPYDSPSASPSLSPYQSPSLSPKVSPSNSFPQLAEEAYHIPATILRLHQQKLERKAKEGEAGENENMDEDETNQEQHKKMEDEGKDLVLQMKAASLNDTDSCSSSTSLEGAAETPPHLPPKQENGTSL
ncbi:Rab interactor 1 [Dissostichus eleginoides]|uniref:Rab interactor 1 n=1 Tax=Dissostichus eleginoides TaxID=100907 RepID=A0AAD9BFD0_DISEL|nr:Rab interactor 1 [Dissostichus eleginoides]